MESNENAAPAGPADVTPGRAARDVVRQATKAALATLDRTSGHPYASLVTVATEADGTPVLLISRLALHTQNILVDARASLLFDASGPGGDPLAGARVTLIGRAEPTEDAAVRRRFLARHPAAAGYATFSDFAFFRLALERAHFVGGFGRIAPLPPEALLLDAGAGAALAAAEEEIVEHMNADHAGAVELYATRLAGAAGGPWRMTGLDCEGMDLACGADVLRISFANPATTPELARRELVRLAAEARALAPGP